MKVAIAGYGDLTRYICEEFIQAGHELVILTRSFKPQIESPGISQAITDYTISSLKAPLADCEVLISTIGDMSNAYTNVHHTLIQACQESPKCKRFIPAEFAVNIETYPDEPGFYYAIHEPVRETLRNQTNLEWTLACAIPQDKAKAHKEKFFPHIHFRDLQEGLSQFDEKPDSIM
ncbi:hypothetical protein TESG_05332 [Trichophyton tonsurans CBS 112818]|uniref:NAD(P)-binding domain-containing protein n=1 Tax=Trichophyton tonsurans (strain CBS 112818) TaxID=647933 RepID=F2S2M7_TRIT1|nr:hypothetical protein TESG_05332 [Trichophyton tonsurans CBS 112818]